MRIVTPAALVFATFVVLAGGPSVTLAEQSKPTRNVPVWVTRTCVTEGSDNCRWDAANQGNGRGHAYVTRRLPNTDTVCVFYIDTRYARTHDHCE